MPSKAPKRRAWPAEKVELWPLKKIKPFPNNPRTHTEEQVALLARSMERYGVTTPVLVDEKGVLIYGHGRVRAAEKIGLDKLPVSVARGWTAEEKRAYRILDNQLTLAGGWDQELLVSEFEFLKGADFDLTLTGFGEAELVKFLAGVGGNGAAGERVGSLAERFGVVPFSVLNAREGWWQDRKRSWLVLGIQSELGRGENLLKFSDTLLEPDPEKRAENAKREEQTERRRL